MRLGPESAISFMFSFLGNKENYLAMWFQKLISENFRLKTTHNLDITQQMVLIF